MPNHVINEMVFRDVDAESQAQIIAVTCGADTKADFSVLVPAPCNLWMGNVGKDHERAFRRTGLDWNRKNWGTKWNAYGHVPLEQSADTITLRFQTAWAPPYPWLAAVLNTLLLPFSHNWLDDGAQHGRCGTFVADGRWGLEWRETFALPEMHRHLHKLLWGVEEFEEDTA